MPLLSSSKKHEKKSHRLNIDGQLLDEIEAYCQWCAIDTVDEFLDQAARRILTKDKEWLAVTADKKTD